MPFHVLPRIAAVGLALSLAAPAHAAGFNGEVTITPRVVTPGGDFLDETGAVLPAVIVAILIMLSSGGGTEDGGEQQYIEE